MIVDSRILSKLVKDIPIANFDCKELNKISVAIQNEVQASDHIRDYVENLWLATEDPKKFNINIKEVDMFRIFNCGIGMSYVHKAAKVNAWLNNRSHIEPIDIDYVFHEVMAHRLVINRIYENNRIELLKQFSQEILLRVPTPVLD